MSNQPWWKRFLSEKPPLVVEAPVQMGIVERRGHLVLVDPEAQLRGVKLVTLASSELHRYDLITSAYAEAQHELTALPKSLRPRRKRVKEVSA